MVALALSHPLMWMTQIQHQMEIFKRCLWTRNQSAGGPRGTQTKVEDSPPLLPFLKHLLSSCYMPDCSEYQRYNNKQSRQKKKSLPTWNCHSSLPLLSVLSSPCDECLIIPGRCHDLSFNVQQMVISTRTTGTSVPCVTHLGIPRDKHRK